MNRRAYISTAVLAAVAGCSQIEGGTGGSTDGTTDTTATSTGTPTPTPTPQPATFEVVGTEPTSLAVGDEYAIAITVQNTGDRDGTFRDTLEGRVPDSEMDWTEVSELEIDVAAGETETWRSDTTETTSGGTIDLRLANDGTRWQLQIVRENAKPMIEAVNLVSDWTTFGDVLENEIQAATAGEAITVGYRHRSVVHDGTLHIRTQIEIRDVDTGERVALDTNVDEQITSGSGYQQWENAQTFDTTDWGPGAYQAEVIIRDEVEQDVSEPATTTFELV